MLTTVGFAASVVVVSVSAVVVVSSVVESVDDALELSSEPHPASAVAASMQAHASMSFLKVSSSIVRAA